MLSVHTVHCEVWTHEQPGQPERVSRRKLEWAYRLPQHVLVHAHHCPEPPVGGVHPRPPKPHPAHWQIEKAHQETSAEHRTVIFQGVLKMSGGPNDAPGACLYTYWVQCPDSYLTMLFGALL